MARKKLLENVWPVENGAVRWKNGWDAITLYARQCFIGNGGDLWYVGIVWVGLWL